MKLNVPRSFAYAGGIVTHEGAPAVIPKTPFAQLCRATMACMLWEGEFYEDGQSIADRIQKLVPLCNPLDVARLAKSLRTEGKLRHAPLLLVRELARHGTLKAQMLTDVIQRADELSEFVALCRKTGMKKGLTAQIKKGLAQAFLKFDEYQLAKYNRDGEYKLRDVLFMCHAKPIGRLEFQDKIIDRTDLWKRLVDGKLAIPDTWETQLSAGEGKKVTFERLMSEGKLGSLALLRNLRNMHEAGVDKSLVHFHLMLDAPKTKALPFRYIAAARAVPAWEDIIDEAMQVALGGQEQLPGKTVLLVDVSGSMNDKLSAKSDLRRLDAAMGLAILLRGVCEEGAVVTFSDRLVVVPPREGMALADAIDKSQAHNGTYLGQAVAGIKSQMPYDRLIVITDEQSADAVDGPGPRKRGYMINVASAENGVGYGNWVRITGFSESVVKFVQAYERVE